MLCGPSALAIAYQYVSEKTTPEKVYSEMRRSQTGHSYFELAQHALNRGHGPTIMTADSKWWHGGRSFWFTMNGGELLRASITTSLVEQVLEMNTPAIFNVAARTYAEKLGLEFDRGLLPLYGNAMYHFTVGLSLQNNGVLLDDPSWGKIQVPLPIFLDALREHHTGGTMIIIKPRSVA